MTDHDRIPPQGPDIDRAIQRHASAYVARGAAISDSITAECIAARDALRTMFTSAAESRQEIRTTGDSLESLSLLADAVWRARETFLDAVGTLNQEGCRQKLAEVLWNDKGGIALALRELVDRRRLDAVPAAKQNISDEMVQAGAKALNPLAFDLDEYGDYTAMPAARCDARTEARQVIVAALRAAPNPSPARSAPTEPTREALEASSTCPICGKDTPHSHYDEDAELELICRPTFEFHLRHWLHMYFPEKRMRRGEMLGVQGWSSRDSYNPQRIIPRRAPADYIDPVIEGLWGQWLAAWLSKPSWCNAFDKIAMAKQIERQSPLAESAALAHPTPTAQTPSLAIMGDNRIGMMSMTEDQIKHMVDRFLAWKLPDSFNPDGGVSFKRLENRYHHPDASPFYPMPTGTNLLDAAQADAMVRYMLDGLPEPPAPAAHSPADSELEALKHDIERLTETNSQLLAQVEELKASIKWTDEVYPSRLDAGGAGVEITWDEFNRMRELAGFRQVKRIEDEEGRAGFNHRLRARIKEFEAQMAAVSSTEGNRSDGAGVKEQ